MHVSFPSEADLDPEPLTWTRRGRHPPLFEASQEPATAEALRKRRERAVKAASEAGDKEPRAGEYDLYPIIVRQGIKNTPDNPHGAKQLVQYVKEYGTPALVQVTWRLRQKLPAIIDDVWEWEHVDESLALLAKSRAERFADVLSQPCVCQGAWRHCAEWALQANGVDRARFCGLLWQSLRDGRSEHAPVVVLMGRHGGEGKSLILSPLREIFGEEHVQASPQPGTFPLLGIETKKIALLDEYTFDTEILPLGTQLLWFEGKSFPVTKTAFKVPCIPDHS